MKTLTLVATLAALTALPALAENQTAGSHFVTNWDTDKNGSVSLEEATTRRGDIFTTFDADEDGLLSEAEYALFDEARAHDQGEMRESMKKQGKKMGHG